jgi:organic radical activating enzyme
MKLREHYQVNEIFNTVQGEGVLTGYTATFVRLQGCTVGCPWCDTKYTWEKGGTRMKTEDIVNACVAHHVVITGGEPTMYNLDGLIIPLQRLGKFVQLETSGQNDIKGNVLPNWITWSPKQNLDFKAAFSIKDNAMEVKWVVDENLPFATVLDTFSWYVKRAQDNREVPFFVMMPEGCPPKQGLVMRTLAFLSRLPEWQQVFFRYGDRIQYRIDVK